MDERRAQDERFVADGPQRMAEVRRRAAEGASPPNEAPPKGILRRIRRWLLNPFDDLYADPEDGRKLWLAEGRDGAT